MADRCLSPFLQEGCLGKDVDKSVMRHLDSRLCKSASQGPFSSIELEKRDGGDWAGQEHLWRPDLTACKRQERFT